MTKIYSYVLRIDDGAAPNPFWGVCTLTICKPAIRRTAEVGDWVIGTGSKNTKLGDGNIYDFSDSIVYAMKITDVKSLKDYNEYCLDSVRNKIPRKNSKDWRLHAGDCLYDYSNSEQPLQRLGVHNEGEITRDLSGKNALISDRFYYFGEEARPLPSELTCLIKHNQGHKKIENQELIETFESWISQFEINKLYASPQMRWLFNHHQSSDEYSACVKRSIGSNDDEIEESVC